MWIAALSIFIFLIYKKRTDFNLKQNSWKILLAGGIIAAHWVTLFQAIKISNISVALSCLSTGAFFGSILDPIINKRALNWREMVLGIIVIIGLSLIFGFNSQYREGIIMALISAFLSTCFTIVNANMVKTSTPYRITFLEMLGGWLLLSLFLAICGQLSISLISLNINDWLWVAVLGVLCTAYAFIENVNLMKQISPFTFLLAINLEPVYGIILALFIFGQQEVMGLSFYVGTLLVLSTVFIEAFLKKKHKL